MREGTRPGTGRAGTVGTAGNATGRAAVVPIDAAAVARVGARYAELYRTRNHQLVEYATSLTGSAPVALDLVAEAHFRVWRRLRAGHEVDSVPAYLTTTVRNLASSLGRAQHEIAHDWRELPHDAASLAASLAETGAAAAGTRRTARASRVEVLTRVLDQLPERWTSALWYAEVEDLPMEAVGARIGASTSTASAELTRARERLREAFLRSQGGTPVDEACADHWELLPAIVRGTASARKTRRIARHTQECEDCRARLVVLTEANSRLPLILGPALLTGVLNGGGAWLVPTAPGTVAATGTAGGGRHARVRPRTLGAAYPQVFTKSLPPAKRLLVGSVGVVGVAAAATAIALGSANSHQAATATAVGAAPPSASPAPAVPGAPSTGAGTGTIAGSGAAAAAAPAASASNPVLGSAPGTALTSTTSLQSASAPAGGLLSPSSLPSSTGAASATQTPTTVAAPSTTASQAPTSAPATTPTTAAPSTSTTPSTTPTTTASTSPSTPATTPSTTPTATTPTASAPATSSPTTPAVTPSATASSAATPADTATSAPTATATPAATDADSAGAVSPAP